MKLRSVGLLVVAEILAMSLWFVSSAVLGDMLQEYPVSDMYGATLSSSVSAGFVIGALLISTIGIADRFDPRRVFALAAILAAVSNALLVLVPVGGWLALLLRFVTGLSLAGVYPVGMKIAVGWGTKDRGWLVGLLVGGLTLGSAAPHLLAFIGGSDWRLATMIASAMALIAVLLILSTKLGPHHGVAARFQARAVMIAWTDRRIRRAFAGYLGHMWELYAMWAWLATALSVSYAMQTGETEARQFAKLTAFLAIGAGALICPFAGALADRVGKARITIIAMSVSGLSALMTAASFGGPIWVVFFFAVIWGLSVIPDSAQFSALIADFAQPEVTGSLMTLQTALGFALTILTVQLTPIVASAFGWPTVFVILSIGPFAGICSMVPLMRLAR